MNSLELTPAATARMQIDSDYLLRRVSILNQLRRNQRTWNLLGEKVAHDFKLNSRKLRLVTVNQTSENELEPCQWIRGKELVYEYLTAMVPSSNGNRPRFKNFQKTSTPLLLSSLSMRLAGALGISITLTRPMVAVMLYAIATAETLSRSHLQQQARRRLEALLDADQEGDGFLAIH